MQLVSGETGPGLLTQAGLASFSILHLVNLVSVGPAYLVFWLFETEHLGGFLSESWTVARQVNGRGWLTQTSEHFVPKGPSYSLKKGVGSGCSPIAPKFCQYDCSG